MTLVKRLRLILLPIILLTFSIAGVLAYHNIYARHINTEHQRLTAALEFFQKEYAIELNSVRSALDFVLGSSELVNFLNQTENSYTAHTLSIMLNNQLRTLRERSPGIRSLQIADHRNQIVVSANEGDPFIEESWPKFPSAVIERNQLANQNYTLPIEQRVLYNTGHNSLSLGIIRQFSSELVKYDTITQSSSQYKAIIDGELNAYRHLTDDLDKDFTQGYSITVKPSGYSNDVIKHTHGTFVVGNDLFVRSVSDSFTVELTVDESNFGNELNRLFWQLAGLVLLLTLVCYGAIWWVIRSQMIKPVRELVDSIKNSKDSNNFKKLSGDSEIVQLNNAYVELVQHVQHISAFDTLTELVNRASFDACLDEEIVIAQQRKSKVGVIYIDLDNFKKVNDHFGHQFGDSLLRDFAQQLLGLLAKRDVIKPSEDREFVDYVARLAGDEFAVILNQIESAEHAESIALLINRQFNQGFLVEGKILDVHVSAGVAIYPDVAGDRQELVVYSDEAKFQAKKRGKNQVQVFTKETADNLELRKFIESELVKSYHSDQFELVYQPIYDSRSMQVACYEVLMRCPRLATHGIGPDQFIPIAEATGLVRLIDLWVIDHAFKTHSKLQQQGYTGKVAINISAIELNNPQFPEQLSHLLRKYKLEPQTIELEITETSLVDTGEKTEQILWSIKQTGVNLALDDFGTGFTGLSQLSKYPIDTLKIDRSFVSNLKPDDLDEQSMFNVIVELANIYGLETVAEGVETELELEAASSKCTYIQGYYLSKPISYEQLSEKALNRQIILT